MPRKRKKAYQIVGDVPTDFSCVSCHGVHIDIIKLQNCEHAMCQSCFSRRVKNNVRNCLCTAILEEAPQEATLKLRHSLEDLEVLCPERCGKTIKLGETSLHTTSECPLATVQCENKECHRKVKRNELSSHMNVCDFRTVSCEGCNKNMKFNDLRRHQISMGCVNAKYKQIVLRESRGSERQLKQYMTAIKQDTFKTMRAERSLEKEYMWKRIERNPDRFSPTLVQHGINESHFYNLTPAASTKTLGSSSSRESHFVPRHKEPAPADSQVCKRCLKAYTFRSNHSESCLWHEGVRY